MHTESFRILSRRVINRISSMNKTIPYRKAIYASQGLKTDALKYNVITASESKTDKTERGYRTGLAVDSLILFTEMGYRFSMTMTAIMMLMSVYGSVFNRDFCYTESGCRMDYNNSVFISCFLWVIWNIDHSY